MWKAQLCHCFVNRKSCIVVKSGFVNLFLKALSFAKVYRVLPLPSHEIIGIAIAGRIVA